MGRIPKTKKETYTIGFKTYSALVFLHSMFNAICRPDSRSLSSFHQLSFVSWHFSVPWLLVFLEVDNKPGLTTVTIPFLLPHELFDIIAGVGKYQVAFGNQPLFHNIWECP